MGKKLLLGLLMVFSCCGASVFYVRFDDIRIRSMIRVVADAEWRLSTRRPYPGNYSEFYEYYWSPHDFETVLHVYEQYYPLESSHGSGSAFGIVMVDGSDADITCYDRKDAACLLVSLIELTEQKLAEANTELLLPFHYGPYTPAERYAHFLQALPPNGTLILYRFKNADTFTWQLRR